MLPLVPAFLVNMAGEAALSGAQRARTVVHALAFVLGFSAIFTLLWIAVAIVGALAGDLVFWLQRAGGILLIVLGMHMLGLITIPLLAREMDLRLEGGTTGLPRSFLIGAAFGIGMTPCVGPYLALILDLLLNQDIASGAFLASHRRSSRTRRSRSPTGTTATRRRSRSTPRTAPRGAPG